ncbi:MAG: 4Fe-4S dicluster domain-containing protein, partial [Firmicutes bacterium]|nr:4Fe-4S dicluster domain-containing protein [Bacillota bacterium]
ACKQWNQLPAENTTFNGTYENPPSLSPRTWMRVTFNEVEEDGRLNWYFGNNRCMHCSDAACITVCPVGAIYRTDVGTVAIDYDKCIGCNYCAANCPFKVISFERQTNQPTKCTFCYDRVANGYKPACANACPTGAIEFGGRSDLINKASDRVRKLQAGGKNKARIYGLEEMSGTGVIFVLQNEPQYYGLPVDPDVPVQARLWGALFKPLRVLVVLAMAFGLWVNRSKSKEIQDAMSAKGKKV